MHRSLFVLGSLSGLALIFSTGCPSPTDQVVAAEGDSQAMQVQPATPEAQEAQTVSTFTVNVDPTVQSGRRPLRGKNGGPSRPLATLSHKEGSSVDFVENELIISTDDPAELAAIQTRWQGTIVKSLPKREHGRSKPLHLVRIDPSGADVSKLPDDLRAVNPQGRSDLRVSTQRGVELLAAAFSEAARGAGVSPNFVGKADAFEDHISNESASGPGDFYDPNAFNWAYMTHGAAHNVSVCEAWRALEFAGKLSNKIKVAVLDGGFWNDPDLPPFTFISTDDDVHLGDVGSDEDKPRHGAHVAHTLAAVPDNNMGTAGVAGPVVDLLLVYRDDDVFDVFDCYDAARDHGAKIMSASYHVEIPWVAVPLIEIWDNEMSDLHDAGILVFASAGNEGIDIDDDSDYFFPCQGEGVICVGGFQTQFKDFNGTTARHPNSNYGDELVPLYAPFRVFFGADPETTGLHIGGGTSHSTPFAAGVAALIWAAQPGQTADQVKNQLFTWAHVMSDNGKKFVNALSPVKHLLTPDGNFSPQVEITAPSNGVHVGYGPLAFVTFSAAVRDFEDGDNCAVTWTSNLDGEIGAGKSVQYSFLSPGLRIITAEAVDSGGAAVPSSPILVWVDNTAPTLKILQPTANQVVQRTIPTTLEISATDWNQPLVGMCASAKWFSTVRNDVFSVGQGCYGTVTCNTTGPRVLTCTIKDEQGVPATATVTIDVHDLPPSGPPVVSIDLPNEGKTFESGQHAYLSGSGFDPDTDAVVPYTLKAYRWTIIFEGIETDIVPQGSYLGDYFTPSQYVYGGPGFLEAEVRLYVTDAQGETGHNMQPRKIKVYYPSE